MYASPGSVAVSESDAGTAILLARNVNWLNHGLWLQTMQYTLPDPSSPPTGEPSGRSSVLLNVVRVVCANDPMLVKCIVQAWFGPVNWFRNVEGIFIGIHRICQVRFYVEWIAKLIRAAESRNIRHIDCVCDRRPAQQQCKQHLKQRRLSPSSTGWPPLLFHMNRRFLYHFSVVYIMWWVIAANCLKCYR